MRPLRVWQGAFSRQDVNEGLYGKNDNTQDDCPPVNQEGR
jgi:hypothetical protein